MTPDASNPVDLEPLDDATLLELRGPIAHRLALLLKAYHRGMFVARDEEERALLEEISDLLGPPERVEG